MLIQFDVNLRLQSIDVFPDGLGASAIAVVNRLHSSSPSQKPHLTPAETCKRVSSTRTLRTATERPAATSQCLKWRSPVKIMATAPRSAASMTSRSRIDPPGWMIAVTPASIARSTPSGNGK
jgi:hypothetical protein